MKFRLPLALHLENLALELDSMPVKLVTLKKIPRMELAGAVVEETDPNKEMTARLWIAWELVEASLARFADGTITAEEWTQIHYRERFQPLGQLSALPDGFYSRSFYTLSRLARETGNDAGRLSHLNRIRGMFRDIIESRIGKITRLSSSEAAAPPKDLQPEEAMLFGELSRFISSWRSEVRKLGVR